MHHARPLPLSASLAFTAWMIVWVTIILETAGAQNFWWLCNLAQFIMLVAVWYPLPLWVSSQAGTVTAVGLVWTLDVAVGLVAGGSLTGITAYMFDPSFSLIQRVSSTYHVWLPAFVLWYCHRQGYDRRGFLLQCVIGSLAIIGSWWLGDPERNLNYTRAPFGVEQNWMPNAVYIPLLCLATAVLVYLPGHHVVQWILQRLPDRERQPRSE